MDRSISGENFTVDIKYVSAVSWKAKSYEIALQMKGNQYCLFEGTRSEFENLKSAVEAYVKAKDDRECDATVH